MQCLRIVGVSRLRSKVRSIKYALSKSSSVQTRPILVARRTDCSSSVYYYCCWLFVISVLLFTWFVACCRLRPRSAYTTPFDEEEVLRCSQQSGLSSTRPIHSFHNAREEWFCCNSSSLRPTVVLMRWYMVKKPSHAPFAEG